MSFKIIIFISIFCFHNFVLAADYSIKVLDTTNNYFIDESINNQIGFSISQKDSSLADLFNSKVRPAKSMLCGPTAVANLMAYYKLTDQVNGNRLKLKYNPENGDYVNQVREFFYSCKTDSARGTKIVNLVNCINQTFDASGFSNFDVKVKGPTQLDMLSSKNYLPPSPVSINDIRDAFKSGFSVIMEIGWYTPYMVNDQILWASTRAHYINIVGYDYSQSFKDQKIILKVVNPNKNYSNRKPDKRFDNINMLKFQIEPGVEYPQGSNYILDGFKISANNRTKKRRAFVRYLILSKPFVDN